ncbi:thiamine phosphate synthase [Ramlibacter sp. MMS24-I3-19]|uniref:thiamine phosphate synthase n=1 Tax=Ramlibacter sp. MMS24-I3-19 TaxID=3416606 RepID=UPI003D062EB2
MTVLVAMRHGDVEVRDAAPAGAHAMLSLDGGMLVTQQAKGRVRSIDASDPAGLAERWAAHMRSGFVASDAALLAVWNQQGDLPAFGWDEGTARPVVPAKAGTQGVHLPGLYAIVDTVPRLRQVLDAGIRLTQLRIKQPRDADAGWFASLRAQLRDGIAAAREAGATLYVNDHWRIAAELGAQAVHLGQEDLLALGDAGRSELATTGMALGVSSHAVWELCRARQLAPAYIACGPVWATTTKDMPWRPQGLDNLGWWVAQAQRPVVAIGGILEPRQVHEAARAGAQGVCLVRGLGEDPRQTVPVFQAAFDEGAAQRAAPPRWPHPSLEPTR